jgi:hypothetical protein
MMLAASNRNWLTAKVAGYLPRRQARLGRAALALIGKFPAEEQSSNLHGLKEVLETGRVTDTSYSVAGKFA